MRYIKTYEVYTGTGNEIDYGVGDTVVCVDDYTSKNLRMPLIKGKEYKVVRIFKMMEDQYLGNKFLRVDVEDPETGEITKGWESTRFKVDFESDAGLYNL